jgi:hypothetical protein
MDGKFGNWFAGFTDGEGCFDIKPVGEYFICRFTIGLRADDKPLLEEIQSELGGIGDLRVQRMRNGAGTQARWEVARKTEVGVLADVFTEYPLRSKKHRDFIIWKQAVGIWLAAQRGSRWHGRSPHTDELRRLRVELRTTRNFHALPVSATP